MEGLISRALLHNWQQKIVALLVACTIWLLVNNSITTVRVFPNVPLRVVNLSPEKTVDGLLHSGLLSQQITLTLTGEKEVLNRIDSSELEVVLDASGKPDSWIPTISRHHIQSLNPEIDLLNSVSRVQYKDFVIRLSRLVTERIPIAILPPNGDPPQGYQFLDVWPRMLYHTISGPEERVEELKQQGLTLTFDLNLITAAELDKLTASQDDLQVDEISFFVPGRWQQVSIPFLNDEMQEINDPEAQNLRIDFLRNEFLTVDWEIPIHLFFSPRHSSSLNPSTLRLATTEAVRNRNGIMTLAIPLYARDISRLFLDTVREHLEVVVIIDPEAPKDEYTWSVQFLDTNSLEDSYVTSLLPSHSNHVEHQQSTREAHLRQRFRDYMQQFRLFTKERHRLQLVARRDGSLVNVQDVSLTY
ncbi:Uncharacterized protein SCG7086_AO_00100 [Chlamydiales bacterium SCGC AG-110-P3]|nr:Uncharacterized protein SCG7086_AO_00100 [Chlamydiales bacterium SCGC AG-110-P3]